MLGVQAWISGDLLHEGCEKQKLFTNHDHA